MSEHTPGPWEVEGGGKPLPVRLGSLIAVRCGASVVAWVPRLAEHDANARLIAAAPDMLAALHEAAEALIWSTGAWREEGTPAEDLAAARPIMRSHIEHIAAAIAKATGGQP